MQVTVQETSSLERRMTVTVPAERLEKEVQNRLNSLARTVKISGFRPGKVPLSEVQRRYGDQVRREVINDMVHTTFQEAAIQEDLEPTGAPHVEINPGADQGLEYTAVFEVYPKIELKAVEGLEVAKPVVEISEQDMTAILDRMQRQQASYEEVDRPAAEGDQVLIDVGSDDDQPGEGRQVPVVLGSQSVMAGVEEALTGVTAGEEKTIEVASPENHPNQEIAGQPVKIQAKVVKVSEPRLPPLDDEFARRFGIEEGGLEAFRKEVRDSMEKEAAEASREVVKRRLLDALYHANEIEIPKSLIADEIKRMTEKSQQPETIDTGDEQLKERARQRVATALLITEVVKQQKMSVNPEKLRAKVESIAASYEDPNQVIEWYYQDRNRLQQLELLVLEEEVVDWLLEQAQVNEVPCSYEELMNMRQAQG